MHNRNRSAGVNPSDVKAALGMMPHAVWPRIPGRYYAGVVLDGPSELVGKQVWGCGGDLGIRRDGTHAGYLEMDTKSVREIPTGMNLREAGAVGVPFVTAFEGFRRAGLPQKDDVVLVFGATGMVGQAAIQIAAMCGARVIGVMRSSDSWSGHSVTPVVLIDASREDIVGRILTETGDHGADVVYNTVGSPYFELANQAMAIGARQILISTIARSVPFDIFTFYRGRHSFVGIDSLALDSTACARILDELSPGFARGDLKPFPLQENSVFDLSKATDAYRTVLSGTRSRVVLVP